MNEHHAHRLASAPAKLSGAATRPRPEPTATCAVTIVIPTYNRAHLLNDSLDSVQEQTFHDYEIVVVDDGSEDQTRQTVEARSEPICYHYQPNQGVAEARNHALRVTHGEFVAFLDSDDIWEPTFLERTIERLRNHPDEALVYTDFVSTDPDGHPLRGHRKKPHAGFVTESLFASTFIHTSAVVARSHIIRDAGGFDGRLSHNEDYDLWLRLSLRHKFGLIPEPLCRRRCHANSLSRNGCSPEILLTKADLLRHFFEHRGGKLKIEPRIAHKRLGKLYYTAAKAFVKDNRPHESAPVFSESLRFHPRNLKTWLWFGYSEASRLWATPRTPPSAAHNKFQERP